MIGRKNLNPILTPELLYALRAMGHCDELVLADCNFPSDSIAAQTTHGSLIRLDGNTISEAADAILSVFPLDSFGEYPVLFMQVVGKPDEVLEVHKDLKKSVDRFSDRDWPMASIERHAFYERAKQAYAVVSTSERRPYGCFILVKGIIGPDGNVG